MLQKTADIGHCGDSVPYVTGLSLTFPTTGKTSTFVCHLKKHLHSFVVPKVGADFPGGLQSYRCELEFVYIFQGYPSSLITCLNAVFKLNTFAY